MPFKRHLKSCRADNEQCHSLMVVSKNAPNTYTPPEFTSEAAIAPAAVTVQETALESVAAGLQVRFRPGLQS